MVEKGKHKIIERLEIEEGKADRNTTEVKDPEEKMQSSQSERKLKGKSDKKE